MSKRIINRLLVVVHPGSACGSAELNLGRFEARSARELLADEISLWNGSIVVLDGSFSDEIEDYPKLCNSLNSAVEAGQANGIGLRLEADDPDHPEILVDFINRAKIDLYTEIVVTGAWYDPSERSGCVNSSVHALRDAGYANVQVSDCALELDFYGNEDDIDGPKRTLPGYSLKK